MYPNPADSVNTVDVVDNGDFLLTLSGSDERRRLRRGEGREERGEEFGEWAEGEEGEEGAGGAVFTLR